MKRNKDGVLVFANEQEKEAYYKKKQEFLSHSDETNESNSTYEMIRKYGEFIYEE